MSAPAPKESTTRAAAAAPEAATTPDAPPAAVPAVHVGQIVCYVLPSGPSTGAVRAALVTAVLADNRVNLTVFLDGTQDSNFVTAYGPILTEWFGGVAYAPAQLHEFGTYYPVG